MGRVLYAIALGTHNIRQLHVTDALRATGIRLTVDYNSVHELVVIHLDHQERKGFRVNRFAINDRWGSYREFGEETDGALLHAQWCHHMNTADGCPRYLDVDGCGCV